MQSLAKRAVVRKARTMVVEQARHRRTLSPRSVKLKPNKLEFLRERTAWPFVHAVVPLALYAVSRNLALSLLLIYVWESFEALGLFFSDIFSESKTNSLIGDPLVGALAIFSLYAMDCAFGWSEPFCATVPLGLRLGAFAVLSLANAFAFAYTPRIHNLSWSLVWAAPLIAALYAGTLLIFFNRVLFRPQSDAERSAGTSVLVWLLLALFYASAATLSPPSETLLSSTFLRVLIAELLVLVVVLVVISAQG